MQNKKVVLFTFYTVFLHFKTLYLDLTFAKEIYLKVFTTEDKNSRSQHKEMKKHHILAFLLPPKSKTENDLHEHL